MPNNATFTYNVDIDGGLSTNAAVTLDTQATIDNLIIGTGNSLTIANNERLTIAGNGTTGTITATGTGELIFASTGNPSDLVITAPNVTLSGAGGINLGNSSTNRIYASNGTFVFTNNSTIQGAGDIGDSQMTFANAGTVNANQPTTMTIDPSGGTTNTGTMEATSGGTLQFNFTTVTNTNGTISAQTGSTVILNGAAVTGGTLTSVGTGVLQTMNGTTLTGLTLSTGSLLQEPNAYLVTMSGTIVNSGMVTLNSTGNFTDLVAAAGGLTLTGGGSIVLGANPNNRIYGANGTTLITDMNVPISGEGQIGTGQLELDNQTVINANVAGGTLVLQPSGSGFTNENVMEATNGGTLTLDGGTFANGTGTLTAASASTLSLSNTTINGGTLSTTGTGLIVDSASSTLNGVILAAGTDLHVSNGQVLTVSGTFANQGAVTLSSTGNFTDLVASGPVTINGGGTITLGSGAPDNRIYGATGTTQITNVNNTISGEGIIGTGQLELVNESVINANVSGQSIVMQPSGTGFVNTGTMEATGGGTLELLGNAFANAGGMITALTGSTVSLNSTTVNGGTLSSAGTGVFVDAATSTLNGVTLAAGSSMQVPNGQALELAGTFTNSGALTLESTANFTDIIATGSVTLTGGGTITLGSGSPNNRIYGANGTIQITNVNNTISGEGQIGSNQLELVNQSVIDANVSGQSIVISPSGTGVANTGTMEATNGATLEFTGGPFTNTGGTVNAGASATLLFSGANFSGGTVNVGGTGTLQLTAGALLTGEALTAVPGAVLQNLGSANTLGGTVVLDAGSSLSVANASELILQSSGTFGNAGAISLNSSVNFTDLVMTGGTVTLSGGGTVALSDSPYNRIYGQTGTETFVNANNTIQGSGEIGANQMTFVNQGTVDANQSVALTIDPSGGTTNTGTMEATGGATLLFSGHTTNNAGGAIIAGPGSTVSLSGVSVTGGTTTVAGTGSLQLSNGASLTGGTLNTVSGSVVQNVGAGDTLGGTVNIAAGSDLNIGNDSTLALQAGGTYGNLGTIALNSTVNFTDLIITGGTVTLSGGGTLLLSNSPYNRIYGLTGTETFDNANNTIQGAGEIGAEQMTFVNQGIVNANQSAGIRIDPNGGTTNSGTMEASGGATLTFAGGTVNNAGGTISALNGSTVAINAVTLLSGGTLSTAGSGVISETGNSVLNNISLALGSVIQVPNANAVTVEGTFTNSGTVSMGATVNFTDFIVPAGGLILTGGGQITLTDSPDNRIYGPSSATTLDNVNNTISGAGQIGLGQLTLTNTGTIIATGTNPLILNVANPFTNQGTLIASGTGGLQFAGGNLTNGGNVAVLSGSSLAVTGQYIQSSGLTSLTNGALNATGVSIVSGIFAGSGTVGASLSNSGLLHPVQDLAITGNLTLTSTSTLLFDIGGTTPSTGYDTLTAPNVTLGGSLDIVFANGFQSTILPGNTFTLITTTGALTGQFAGLASGSYVQTIDGAGSFEVTYLPTSLELSNFVPVPEPSTVALLAVGALALAAAGLVRARRA